ncbi:putative heat shock protein 70 family protein, partial [Tanacetum coccineum]
KWLQTDDATVIAQQLQAIITQVANNTNNANNGNNGGGNGNDGTRFPLRRGYMLNVILVVYVTHSRQDLGFIPSGNVVLIVYLCKARFLGADHPCDIVYRYQESWNLVSTMRLGEVDKRDRVWKNDRIEIVPNDQGNRTTPSCVAFTRADRLIGDAAKNQLRMNPTDTIFG